jgi:asparagine synthase (glutamine-hydrolysing)
MKSREVKMPPAATLTALSELSELSESGDRDLTMCGICGIYEWGPAEPAVTGSLITAMRDEMTHRGPDDAGVYVTADRRLGLGHRRLSIVDLTEAGRNPMTNEDGQIWITFNGEIYNHQPLRERLLGIGHLYRSRTDTETILHLYEERGLDFVQEIEGFFAIGLWDNRQRKLILVRDRVGIKPLYYTVSGGRLIFASEIKAILAHPSVSRDINEEALYHYLTFLATPPPQTLFAGINKLPAGCMLTCTADGETKVARYWDAVASASDRVLTEEETVGEIYRLLQESVRKRMMSDVPFGVFLSGGVDSTSIVALLSQMISEPVRTFTVGFKDSPEYNELEEARWVAQEYGADHHEVVIDQQDLLDSLPELIFHQDEPIADPVCVPLHYVSRLTRETGTKVIQVGEGSDELFCGYSNYASFLDIYRYLWNPLAKLPRTMRKAMSAVALAGYNAGGRRLLPVGKKLVPDLLRRFSAGEEIFWSGAFIFDETSKGKLIDQSMRHRLDRAAGGSGLSSYSLIRADLDRLLAARPGADQLERMIYQELKLRLPELLLMRVDKITMASSLEARVPFLDHKLVEFAMGIPQHMKYQGGQTKRLLKLALKGKIPDRVLQRKKKGFGVPVSEWMLDRLGPVIEASIMGSRLRRRELFDYGYIKHLFDEQRSHSTNYSFFIWSLFNLALWYDRWIEGRPLSHWTSAPGPDRLSERVELGASVK